MQLFLLLLSIWLLLLHMKLYNHCVIAQFLEIMEYLPRQPLLAVLQCKLYYLLVFTLSSFLQTTLMHERTHSSHFISIRIEDAGGGGRSGKKESFHGILMPLMAHDVWLFCVRLRLHQRWWRQTKKNLASSEGKMLQSLDSNCRIARCRMS